MFAQMKTSRLDTPVSLIETGVRMVLAAVFLISGITKLAAPETFATIIDAYGILPESLSMPTAITLATLEIVAALGVVFNQGGSLELMMALMVIFMAVLAYGIHMGLDVDCGCFGPSDPEAKAFHGLRSALFRDVGLMTAMLVLYCRRRRR